MPKRPRDDDPAPAPKRARLQASALPTKAPPPDRLSRLSDELLLRILHRLPAAAHLLAVARVSRRFWRLAADGPLWRAFYRKRFRGGGTGSGPPETAPDWQRAYRLRLNWTRGTCAVTEVPLDLDTDDDGHPPLLQVAAGLVVTADARHGIRVWGGGKGGGGRRRRRLLAQAALGGDVPTALSVHTTTTTVDDDDDDDHHHLSSSPTDIAVALRSGGFSAWRLDRATHTLVCRGRLPPPTGGSPPTAIAYAHPYVLTATDAVAVSLYTLHKDDDDNDDGQAEAPPVLLTALAAPRTARPPLALGVRLSSSSSSPTDSVSSSPDPPPAVAVLAYTVAARRGWALGLQELHIGGGGPHARPAVVSSGLAFSAVQDEYEEEDDEDHLPTALAYAHPHLLATLPDNTMVVHRCRGGASSSSSSSSLFLATAALSLSLSPGVRLWGHTSGIAAAAASAATATAATGTTTTRARAVSVSRRGDELRVWELEGRPPVAAEPGRSVVVRVAGGGKDTEVDVDVEEEEDVVNDRDSAALSVGLDDERVVVLKDARSRRARLLVYDFS